MREHHVNSEGVGLENAERGVTTPGLAHEAAHAEKVRSDELYRQQLEEARRRDPAQPPPPQLRKSRRHLSMVRIRDPLTTKEIPHTTPRAQAVTSHQ